MCNATAAKYLVFTFNLVFWLIGLFFIGIGIWARVDEDFLKTVSCLTALGPWCDSFLAQNLLLSFDTFISYIDYSHHRFCSSVGNMRKLGILLRVSQSLFAMLIYYCFCPRRNLQFRRGLQFFKGECGMSDVRSPFFVHDRLNNSVGIISLQGWVLDVGCPLFFERFKLEG